MFREVASGAKTDRAQLRRLLDQLEAGDVLTVTRLDRLARSTRDLLNTLAAITAKGGGIPGLGRRMGRHHDITRAADADRARRACRVRARPNPSTHGRRAGAAVARGVKIGRKPKLTPHQQKEALKRREQGEPVREIGRSFNVSHSTISRLVA